MQALELLSKLQADRDFVELSALDNVIIDLKYASCENFMRKNLYGEFNRAFLHRIAYAKLEKVLVTMLAEYPGWKLKIFDTSRPRYVQSAMWSWLENSPEQRYLADPEQGSIHSYGFAVDLSMVDQSNLELDMGTAFDAFSPLSEPRHESRFMHEGKLSKEQLANRLILRKIMTQAGFSQLPIEWWHYDALPADEVRRNYTTID